MFIIKLIYDIQLLQNSFLKALKEARENRTLVNIDTFGQNYRTGSKKTQKTTTTEKQTNYNIRTHIKRSESPVATVTWHASRYKVHKLHQRYILNNVENSKPIGHRMTIANRSPNSLRAESNDTVFQPVNRGHL